MIFKLTPRQKEYILAYVVLLTMLICCWGLQWSEDVLKPQFFNNGEAYSKGYGHILSENFTNGLIFLVTRHITTYTIFIFPTILAISQYQKLLTFFNIVAILTLLCGILFFSYKSYIIHYNSYDGINRVIEIGVMWTCSLASYLFAIINVLIFLKE